MRENWDRNIVRVACGGGDMHIREHDTRYIVQVSITPRLSQMGNQQKLTYITGLVIESGKIRGNLI